MLHFYLFKAQNLIRILNLFEEKCLTVDEQRQLFVNKKNFHLKYFQFNTTVNFLIALNLCMRKVNNDENEEFKLIINDITRDLISKLNNSIVLHRNITDENKNQLK